MKKRESQLRLEKWVAYLNIKKYYKSMFIRMSECRTAYELEVDKFKKACTIQRFFRDKLGKMVETVKNLTPLTSQSFFQRITHKKNSPNIAKIILRYVRFSAKFVADPAGTLARHSEQIA